MLRRDFIAAATVLLAGTRATADPGIGDAGILIGQTGVLSGPLGGTIKSMISGAQLAFGQVNGQGGVSGRTIRLISLDDELNPDKAVANVQRLLTEHHVLAFFGCRGSSTTAAVAPLIAKSGVPMVGGYAVADSSREKVKGSAYFVRASTGREAEALVEHLTTIGITQIAMAHLDNPGGREARALVESALEARQLKLLVSAAMKGDASNAGDIAKSFAMTPPQAVIMYLSGILPGELMKAVWALKYAPMFYGMSIVAGEVTAQMLGAQVRGMVIAQVVPYPWAVVDPVVRNYRRLADANGVPLSYYSFEGYLSAQVLIEALKRCGRDLTHARLHAALRGLRMRLAGMEIDFSSGSTTGSRYIDMVQVTSEGRFLR